MTRADVLSYRGNGQPAAPNKTLRASLHLPTPRTGFILTFMQATLANSKKKIAFDILTGALQTHCSHTLGLQFDVHGTVGKLRQRWGGK